jgi:hypothetical protein
MIRKGPGWEYLSCSREQPESRVVGDEPDGYGDRVWIRRPVTVMEIWRLLLRALAKPS